MKFKSLLAILFIAPIAMVGNNKGVDKIKMAEDTTQVELSGDVAKSTMELELRGGMTRSTEDVVFVNTGSMYVSARKDADNTVGAIPANKNQVIYINGSLDATVAASKDRKVVQTLIADNSGIAVLGNVKNLVCTLDKAKNTTKGAIWMIGGSGLEASLDLYKVNDGEKNGSASYNSDNGRFLKKKQYIQGTNVLPNLVVDDFTFVMLEPSDPVSSTTTTVLHIGNTNELAGYNKAGNVVTKPTLLTDDGAGTLYVRKGGLFAMKAKATPSKSSRTLNTPILGISNKVQREEGSLVNGEVMYEMDLYQRKSDKTIDNGLGEKIATNPIKEDNAVMLTPFSSPYVKLGADYMLFNTLTEPRSDATAENLPVFDPKYKLERGRAYFIAQDVSDFDHEFIKKRYASSDPKINPIGRVLALDPDDRAQGGYLFNRAYFLSKKTDFNFFVGSTEKKDIFRDEVFASSGEEVVLELVEGFNYLANPYMMPIDMSLFSKAAKEPTSEITLTDWGVDAPIYVSAKNNRGKQMLRPKFWVPHNAKISHYTQNLTGYEKDFYAYKVSFWVNQPDGGTTNVLDNKEGTLNSTREDFIAPLSIFAVQANQTMKVKIPYNYQKAYKTGTNDDLFIPGERSARVETEDDSIDDIVLESRVYSLDASDDDEAMTSIDRIAVVLRENATFAYDAKLSDDFIDAEKAYMSTEVLYDMVDNKKSSYSAKALTRSGEPLTEMGGALYTKSSDGVALTTNAVPLTAREIPVYFTPPTSESRVVIKPYRLASLQAYEKAWLVDKYEDKTIELTPETEYEFISKPLDDELINDNRFILRFGFEDDDIIVDEELPIYCHYNTNTLFIGQLNDNDINSSVKIYDMQGRLVGATKISNAPNDVYTRPLHQGAYVVKIEGNRKFTTKIMVLP